MNMKRLSIYLTIALLALVGCGKEPVPAGVGEITVEATVGAMTKTTDDGVHTQFTAGDRIAVYAWLGSATEIPASRQVDGVANMFDGSKWTPAMPMFWKNVSDPHYFLGIYPTPTTLISDFTAVPYTLNPADNAASDLLLATTPAGVQNSGVAVPLSFKHAMARLSVNLRLRSDWTSVPDAGSVSVTVEAKDGATVNYLTQAVTCSAAAPVTIALPAAASAAPGYALSFSGIQVPQTGVRSITVVLGGVKYVYTANADIPLESGKHTTLGLAMGNDRISLDSVSVADWTSGASLPGGEAKVWSAYVDMGEVDINGVKKHLYWSTCNIGAANPWDYGDYYAWGETTTKNTYDWGNYAFMQAGQADRYHITKYTTADDWTVAIWYDGNGNFIGDGKSSFADYNYVDDAARQIWGGNWRIPTDAEWTALRDASLYDWVWTTDYKGFGKNGMLVTRKSGTGPCSGNSIFLPAAGSRIDADFKSVGTDGLYWSSSLYIGSGGAWYVCFYSNEVKHNSVVRSRGLSLRPVFAY